MKTTSVSRLLLLICAAALPAYVATAQLSLPANIYYGEVRGVHGLVLTGMVNVAVIARVNGYECARTYVDTYLADGVNYALRVPVDDGLSWRYEPYAAREGERPEIVIMYDNAEFESDSLAPPVGPPASLQVANVQAVPEPGFLFFFSGLLCAALRRFGSWQR